MTKSPSLGTFIEVPDSGVDQPRAERVGGKAMGLWCLPTEWTPPFFVIVAMVHECWRSASLAERTVILERVGREAAERAAAWLSAWPRGVVLRSSATAEDINDRGSFRTEPLPADYSDFTIAAVLEAIYQQFDNTGSTGLMAVIVQALAPSTVKGHVSNERRVSKTVNHWVCEIDGGVPFRFNSQRSLPAERAFLRARVERPQYLKRLLKSVGRWCTELHRGPAHLEWCGSGSSFWIVQIDFEDEQRDAGDDPRLLLRDNDPKAPVTLPPGSPIEEVRFEQSSPWSKIDKVRRFLRPVDAPYPQLFSISGHGLNAATDADLAAAITTVTHGRAICRTDCLNPHIERVNLPRTHTVSAEHVVSFMRETSKSLQMNGAKSDEICFIIHKFIPARACAWARASPGQPIVEVDSLWGLPDGLQYLPHDTFEYDIVRNAISSERLRYKPKYLQETASGAWELRPVARALTRRRSLSSSYLRDVARRTSDIARSAGKSVLVMWFCDVAAEVGVGANVAWFMMDAPDRLVADGTPVQSVGTRLRREPVRDLPDLEALRQIERGSCVVELDPGAERFRDNTLIEVVAEVAKDRNLPVILSGSQLSHAYYLLKKNGVHILPADAPRHLRTRQRRVFEKLVRDKIPEQITGTGERVLTARIGKEGARAALVTKLLEEAHELLTARSAEDVAAELGDVLEVLRSLADVTGVDWQQVIEFAERKKASRGSFNEGVVLLETEWPTREVTGERAPSTIRFNDLGRIRSEGTTHMVNYPALVGNEAAIKLSDGTVLRLRLTSEGLNATEGSCPPSRNTQLKLDV